VAALPTAYSASTEILFICAGFYDTRMKFVLGKKVGMTTIQDTEKGAQNVTLIECLPNKVSFLRTGEQDGYVAVQVEVAKTSKRLHRQEFRLDLHQDQAEAMAELGQYTLGQSFSGEIFAVGDTVSVTGTSKAKGFQGVVKRHGFKGGPRSHGHKDNLRAPGSIGSTEPQHVIKGMRMAGRMGGVTKTSTNLSVAFVDAEKHLIAVEGAVPGNPGGIVAVRTVHKKK
jgi:large subunit ribosomal protein L3